MSRSRDQNAIRLRGVRHNNLKGFDLDVPAGRLVVITGLSGSGKSSLAFDTLYAEGQRRYIETFSPYARQFFDRMDKPRVDSIEGIPPAIAIEQRNTVRSTRSTVGTMTEVCEYMKVLWPHIAQLHCRQCGQPVRRESPQLVWESLRAHPARPEGDVLITFHLPLSEKLSLDESLQLIARQGYQRLLAGNDIVRIDEAATHPAWRKAPSTVTVVQDRLRLSPSHRHRFVEACEQAYHFGKGKLAVHPTGDWPDTPRSREAWPVPTACSTPVSSWCFSNRQHCASCDLDYSDPSPALFSFNHPVGACPTCRGFGRIITIDYHRAIPDRSMTLAGGAVKPWQSGMSAECQRDMMRFCRATGVPANVPFQQLSEEQQRWIIEGDPDYGSDEEHEWPRAWYGVKGYFRWLESKAYKMHVRVLLSRYRAYTRCPDCSGARFNRDSLLYWLPFPRAANNSTRLTLADFYRLPLRDSSTLINELARRHAGRANAPLRPAFLEVQSRLQYLNDIGLGYLTLDRPTRTLSGGETERVNLAACLGTRLVNTLFVLDEPSVGLHPRDTDRLVRILQALRNEGNTVVVVEHERSVMEAADRIVDLGPGHGAGGGEVVFQGSYGQILESGHSLTGSYLSGTASIEVPARRPVRSPESEVRQAKERRTSRSETEVGATRMRESIVGRGSELGARAPDLTWLRLENANRHNLKNLTVEIPLNRFVCVSGVSGSGKSTLIREVLLPALRDRLGTPSTQIKASDRMLQEDTHETQDGDDGTETGPHQAVLLEGCESIARVVVVDQAILGKTPRSNPAVYTGAFDHIRELFAQTDTARRQGLNASAFCFNSAQGQCERCRGAGFEKVEMQFLSDVFIRCPDCNGRRYREHILEVRLQNAEGRGMEHEVNAAKAGGKSNNSLATGLSGARTRRPPETTRKTHHATPSLSIADMLESTVDEAVAFLDVFAESKPAQRAVAALRLLQEVGLGYLQLGQPINTLSGGESQRLKLVRHLAEAELQDPNSQTRRPTEARPPKSETRARSRSHRSADLGSDSNAGIRQSNFKGTLFLLDEPTTGLHFDDVRVLLNALQRLVDAGHSLVVIEHNVDVLKCADWIVDLGPEAGDEGGRLVAAGTPEGVAACKTSHTGRFLRDALNHRSRGHPKTASPVKRPGRSGASKRAGGNRQ